MTPRIPSCRRALVVLGLTCAAGGCAGKGEAERLVERCVEAHGGREALAKARAIKQEGRTLAVARGGAIGSMIRGWDRPDRLRVELVYPGVEPEVRILDGAKGWRQGAPATGPQLTAMVLQAARHGLPLSLAEHLAEVRDAGAVTRDGREFRVLELPLGADRWLTVELDPATALVARTVGRAGPLEFATAYEDYRTVEGVRYAFRETTWAQGVQTAETILDDVTVEPSFPPAVFAPPSTAAP